MNANKSNGNFSRRDQGGSCRRFAIMGGVLGIIASLMVMPFANIINSVAAAGAPDSVIIQLKDDPAAVWKAKQQKAGQSVSDAQLAAYRNNLKTRQDQF